MRAITTTMIFALLMITGASTTAGFDSVSEQLAREKGCLSCHEGIGQFSDGPMMDAISAIGSAHGDPGGCVVCHGGNPGATDKQAAYEGAPEALKAANGPEMFYPDPGSVWIAHKTCGQDNVCLPPGPNQPDEVRWAFMLWTHKNFGERDMPTAEGLRITIKSAFACEQ